MASTGLFDDPGSAGVGQPTMSAEAAYGDPRVQKYLKWINRAEPYCNKWKEDAKQCYRFRDGRQLSEEDEKALRDQQRPANAFNSAQKYVRYVCGVQRDSHVAMQYNALSLDNAIVQIFGDELSKYYDWAMRLAKGDTNRSRAFEDF